jgi:hypothetical protein
VTPVDQHGAELSPQRAFVVHLAAAGGPRRRRFQGRVEHLSSGASTHFSSLEGLLAFFAAAPEAAPARPAVYSGAPAPLKRAAAMRRRRPQAPTTGG